MSWASHRPHWILMDSHSKYDQPLFQRTTSDVLPQALLTFYIFILLRHILSLAQNSPSTLDGMPVFASLVFLLQTLGNLCRYFTHGLYGSNSDHSTCKEALDWQHWLLRPLSGFLCPQAFCFSQSLLFLWVKYFRFCKYMNDTVLAFLCCVSHLA